MIQLMSVDDERRDDVLVEAAERRVQIVLSHRLDNVWTTHKSRVLQADAANRCLVIEQPGVAPGQAPPELAPGERIGLTFRRGHKKCMCSVAVVRLGTFELTDAQTVPAVYADWPENLQEIQRRVYYRAAVPAGRRIEASMWDGGLVERKTADLQHVPHHTGLLQDVSAGGCRVLVEGSRNPQFEAGDTVGIQFQPDPRSAPLLLEAMFRHLEELPHGKLSLGFQFMGLEMTPEGRALLQMLSRVVSIFLRIEMRRKNDHLQKNRRRRQ